MNLRVVSLSTQEPVHKCDRSLLLILLAIQRNFHPESVALLDSNPIQINRVRRRERAHAE